MNIPRWSPNFCDEPAQQWITAPMLNRYLPYLIAAVIVVYAVSKIVY